jgi:transcriptional regulator with XRE-family HTH domain
MKKGESDQQNRIGSRDPIRATGIGSRIGEVASTLGTRKHAADIAGISADTLQRYIREEVTPSFEPLARMAHGAGVSLDWLATGEGRMLLQDSGQFSGGVEEGGGYKGVSPAIIRDVVQAVEEFDGARYGKLPPERKAELIAGICRQIADDEAAAGHELERRTVARYALLGLGF